MRLDDKKQPEIVKPPKLVQWVLPKIINEVTEWLTAWLAFASFGYPKVEGGRGAKGSAKTSVKPTSK